MDTQVSEWSDWLVRTKLHPPLLREDVIPRPRLWEVLRYALTSYALTLVSAPAGYGKTTLLRAGYDLAVDYIVKLLSDPTPLARPLPVSLPSPFPGPSLRPEGEVEMPVRPGDALRLLSLPRRLRDGEGSG